MPLTSEQLTTAKAQPLADLLADRGHHPAQHNGHTLAYLSPFRQEHTPSFMVDVRANRYTDFGSSERQCDAIDLLCRLDGIDFATAVSQLLAFDAGSAQQEPTALPPASSLQANTKAKPGLQLRKVKLLNDRRLLSYVESRGIGPAVARRYLSEVYYGNKPRPLYGIGWPTVAGSWTTRMTWGAKLFIGPAAHSLIEGSGGVGLNIFEGMFDFLSALEYHRLTVPTCRTIVLNSTAQLPRIIDLLTDARPVNAWLDRDATGLKALNDLRSHSTAVCDRSGLYAGFNDFNDFWANHRNTVTTNGNQPISRNRINEQKGTR